MSYCLKPAEDLAVGIRRIAREELESALVCISSASAGDEAVAVHQTRKHIKKLRALLRLIRDEIGREIFKEENARLRGVARGFSGARDARVQLQLLEKLRPQAHSESSTFPHTAAALEQDASAQGEDFGPRRIAAEETLLRICDRLEGWPLDGVEIQDLCCALRRAYKRGRDWFGCVSAKPTTENLHSWRKQVKDIWYQARLLRKLNEVVMGEMVESVKTLGQKLGNLHDMAFFRIRLQAWQGEGEDERALLLGLICTRENELQEIALDLGARFFAEKPGAFEKRLLRYARDWPARSA
ncbi:MAG: CHAD domain-containing protein [Chthoniobacterales bacterium]|nr:CHAD domain-containing protein [Chthoniobacterales bacterium]